MLSGVVDFDLPRAYDEGLWALETVSLKLTCSKRRRHRLRSRNDVICRGKANLRPSWRRVIGSDCRPQYRRIGHFRRSKRWTPRIRGSNIRKVTSNDPQ